MVRNSRSFGYGIIPSALTYFLYGLEFSIGFLIVEPDFFKDVTVCQSNGSCNLSVWRQSFIIGIRNNAIPSRPESSVATAVGPGRSTPAITTSTITTMTEIAATTRAGLASGRITPEMVIGLPRQPRQLKETQISSEIGKQLKTRKGAKARISESEFSGSNLQNIRVAHWSEWNERHPISLQIVRPNHDLSSILKEDPCEHIIL